MVLFVCHHTTYLPAYTGTVPAHSLISASYCLLCSQQSSSEGLCLSASWRKSQWDEMLQGHLFCSHHRTLPRQGQGSWWLVAYPWGEVQASFPQLRHWQPDVALRICYKCIFFIFSGHAWPNRRLLCTPASLHSTMQDFAISKSNAIPVHLYDLAWSPLVQEWQPVTPACKLYCKNEWGSFARAADVLLGPAEIKLKKQKMPQI